MAITYPAAANNPIKRLAYMIRMHERWRLIYNLMGKWNRTGITLTEYNTLPARIKNKLAYTDKLTSAQWRNAKNKMFTVRIGFIDEYLSRVKQITDDTTYNPDPTDGVGNF